MNHVLSHFGKYTAALCIALVAAFAFSMSACVTPQDTQALSTAHAKFDADREEIARKLAAAELTNEQAVAELKRAYNALADEVSRVGKDVSDRTKTLVQDPLSLLTVLGTNVLTALGTNTYRSSREVKTWGTPEKAEAEMKQLRDEIERLKNTARGAPVPLAAPTT